MNQIEVGTWQDPLMLPSDELQSIHRLAMGYVLSTKGSRRQRVLERGNDHRYHFVLLDDSGEMPADNSGAIDTYLGIRVAKLGARNWGMRVSFLENVMATGSRGTGERTIYDMEWNAESGIGMKWQVQSIANMAMNACMAAHSSEKVVAETLDAGNAVRTPEPTLQWMEPSDLNYIASRMLDVAAHVASGRRVAA
jgi:hypothetical protein